MGVKVKNTNHHYQEKPPSSMGVLKKVKKRLGLCGRGLGAGSGVCGPNNLPPLLFHQVHGDNIRVSWDGRTATRAESFCKGITFSARPVKVAERICVRFLEVSNNWSGVLRFGFTSNDPGVLRYSLPKYSCPDLTSKPGYWAKALSERFCEKNAVLHYYVTSAGDVHYGINGEEKGIFFGGVDTRSPLWAIIDVYGNSTSIEFLDSGFHLNNRRSSSEQEIVSTMSALQVQEPAALQRHPQPLPPPSVRHSPPPPQQQQQLPLTPVYSDVAPLVIETNNQAPPRPAHHRQLLPVTFHSTRGKNIRMSVDKRTAWRRETEFCGGYVFMNRPIAVGEKILIEVCASEPVYLGSMGVGVTSCDPATLLPQDLPNDSDQLLDRGEYWSLAKDIDCRAGETLAFWLTPAGELCFHANCASAPTTLIHVDLSTSLWFFIDVYGSTQKIKMLGALPPPPPVTAIVPSNRNLVSPSSSNTNCCPPVTVTTTAGVGGGTVLVVSLPPPTTAQFVTEVSPPRCDWSQQQQQQTPPSDCSVCYERPVDSALYTCGHMCMCYECAVQQWRGKGGGHCPLCRAVIRDVIRTFRS